MKKFIFPVLVFFFIVFILGHCYAAGGKGNLPNQWTYAKEWGNIHLLTWRSSSKVIVLDRYATIRANDIKLAYDLGKANQIDALAKRYANLEKEINAILSKKRSPTKNQLIEMVVSSTIKQQKLLSEVRQNTSDINVKKALSVIQEEVVNQTKSTISAVKDSTSANNFTDQVVAAWRDPEGSVKNEKETRVYAAGTETSDNNSNNGVIIDKGEAKIVTDKDGNLKIEYAPGTGVESVTTDNGQKIWKIVQSDGTVIDSYTASKNVVVGGTVGTASNIIVNSVSGGTATSANNVVGGTIGTGGVKVEGGKPSVKTDTDVNYNSSSGSGNVIVK